MKLSFTTLDAFSSTRYAGNPVAVVKFPASAAATLTQAQKQSIAQEFNLSEIVFLHTPDDPAASNERTIDIFTSMAEIPFAGHPTIGTSHYLLKSTKQDIKAVITKAGRIPIWVDENTGNVKVEVPHDFHRHAVTWPTPLNGLQNPTCSIVNGMAFIFVELPDIDLLAKAEKNLNPSTYDTSPLDAGWQSGLIGTMYFVAQGVDELGRKKYRTRMWATRQDPGTGSASSGLACYLALRDGASKFVFTQGIEMGRKNVIEVEVVLGKDGKEVEKVLLSGEAVEVMEGTLEV